MSLSPTRVSRAAQSREARRPVAEISPHAPSSAVFNTGFNVGATASSGFPVTFGSSGSCTNTGASFTMTSGAGQCIVTYTQGGTGNYNGIKGNFVLRGRYDAKTGRGHFTLTGDATF